MDDDDYYDIFKTAACSVATSQWHSPALSPLTNHNARSPASTQRSHACVSSAAPIFVYDSLNAGLCPARKAPRSAG